jgi:hypothetical protein
MQLDLDSFSTGQVESKLWAAQQLEECVRQHNIGPLDIYILGGWYALLHFILQVRQQITINSCRSFDLDPSACSMANVINNTWESKDWAFRSFPQDMETVDYPAHINCVINTSTEHIKSNTWFDRIPKGTLCLIQSNDLVHIDHVNNVSSIAELKSKYNLSECYVEDSKIIGTYTRYMIIGKK